MSWNSNQPVTDRMLNQLEGKSGGNLFIIFNLDTGITPQEINQSIRDNFPNKIFLVIFNGYISFLAMITDGYINGNIHYNSNKGGWEAGLL